jgi:hypothetical protein
MSAQFLKTDKVCTDIAPADVEPDDMESMVHLMAVSLPMLLVRNSISSVKSATKEPFN